MSNEENYVEEPMEINKIKPGATVQIEMDSATLERLKLVFRSYLDTEDAVKVATALGYVSGMFEQVLKGKSNEDLERVNELEESIFVQNVRTLFTLTALIESKFIQDGSVDVETTMVKLSPEGKRIYDEHLAKKAESKKKD